MAAAERLGIKMDRMRVIKTRDYKLDRGRTSRPAPCRARPACMMPGTRERRPDYFPCTQPRENR
ncbi:Xanthine dehydrogenase [Burkholderia ambifaria]